MLNSTEKGGAHPNATKTVSATLQTVIALAATMVVVLAMVTALTPFSAAAEESETTTTGEVVSEANDDTGASDEEGAGQSDPEAPAQAPATPSNSPETSKPAAPESSPAKKPETPASETSAPAEKTESDSESASEDSEGEEDEDYVDVLQLYNPYNGAVYKRSRSARSAGGADPRFQCGLDIALVLDTSRSTSQYQKQMRDAAKVLVNNLAGTGSKLSIITFHRQATTILPSTELDESGVRAAQAAIDGARWAFAGNESGSNYAAAFDAARAQNVNATIVVGDGVPVHANRTHTTSNHASTYTEDIVNTYNAAQQLRASGSAIYSIAQQTKNDSKVFADVPGDPLAGLNHYVPDSEPLVEGVYVTGLYYNRTGKRDGWKPVNPREHEIVDTPEGRGVRSKFGGSTYPLFNTRSINGRNFLAGFSNDVIDTNANFSDLSAKINSLSEGCWGTVTVKKQIVNGSGEVQPKEDVSGFEFVADKALNGDRVQDNYTMGTNNKGEAVFHYPTIGGTGAMTLRENPRDGYRIFEQSVNGAKTVARCSAVGQGGKPVPVSYGSGSGIVVTSDPAKQSFTLSGVGTQHRVECLVQNTKGEAAFALAKRPTHGDQTYPIQAEAGKEIIADYTVEVSNTGSSEGAAPELKEKPSAPKGLKISSVTVHPEGNDPLVESPQQLSRESDGTWTLESQKMKQIAPDQKRTARVSVTYAVDRPEDLKAENLRCTPGDNSKGLFNHVEFRDPKDKEDKADTCITATLPKVALSKTINKEDADTKDKGAAILGGTDKVTVGFELRNTGSTPLTHFRLTDSTLNAETGAKEGAIEMPELKCIGADIRKDADGYVITPTRAINENEAVSCAWEVGAPIVPEPGEYHGDRGRLEGFYEIPGVPHDKVSPVVDENDAWLFKLPVAVGTLPDAGGFGYGRYLMIGSLCAAFGLFAAYRRRA